MTPAESLDVWALAGVSVRGTSHVKHGIVCQDAHAAQLAGGALILAVCDGAGSAPMSHLGSRAAAETAVEAVARELLRRVPETSSEWVGLLESARAEALSAVREQAEAAGFPVRDLATTLLLAVAAPEVTAVLQIGDGAVVGEELATPHSVVAMTRPETGEYANETVFLTTSNTTPQVSVGPPVRSIAAFSDGLQRLALQLPAGTPHEPFFRPLFRFMEKAGGEERSEEIRDFLSNPRVTSRTDDDITLVVASRRT
jgi:hypothetical protein